MDRKAVMETGFNEFQFCFLNPTILYTCSSLGNYKA